MTNLLRISIVLCVLTSASAMAQGPRPSVPPERLPEERERPPAPVAVVDRNGKLEAVMARLLEEPSKDKKGSFPMNDQKPQASFIKRARHYRRMTKRSSAKW